jgi:hypothetical protein
MVLEGHMGQLCRSAKAWQVVCAIGGAPGRPLPPYPLLHQSQGARSASVHQWSHYRTLLHKGRCHISERGSNAPYPSDPARMMEAYRKEADAEHDAALRLGVVKEVPFDGPYNFLLTLMKDGVCPTQLVSVLAPPSPH